MENLTDEWRRRLELQETQNGVRITEVEFDSEAQRKGLGPNMVVIAVNNHSVDNVTGWIEQLDGLQSGAPVKLDLLYGQRAFSAYLRVPPREEE